MRFGAKLFNERDADLYKHSLEWRGQMSSENPRDKSDIKYRLMEEMRA